MRTKYTYFLLFATILISVYASFEIYNRIKIYQTLSYDGFDLNNDSIFRLNQHHFSELPGAFTKNSRLFYLCKVWGFVKYYGQNQRMLSQIDDKLLKAMPQTIHCKDKNEFSSVLSTLIASLDTNNTSKKNFYPPSNYYNWAHFEWMNDTIVLNESIRKSLQHVFNCHAGKTYFIDYKNPYGSVQPINEKVYTDTLPDYSTRMLGLFRFWNWINYFYPYKAFAEDDWDHILREVIPLFESAQTPREYHLAIHWLTTKLKDTHTSSDFLTDEVVCGRYRPNFGIIKLNHLFMIDRIRILEEDTPFKIGDQIIQINHKDVHQLYDSLRSYTGGGNYWVEQSFVCAAMLASHDSVSSFMIQRANDTLVLTSANKTLLDYEKYNRPYVEKRKKEKQYKWLNDSIAYMDLQYLTSRNFTKNYQPVRNAKALILDLRCYPDHTLISNLINAFVPPSDFFAYAVYPDIRFPGLFRYNQTSNKIGRKDCFKGTIVVLVNEWTRSYSEYLTMALQANPKVITVGNSTAGADGNINIFDFPGNVRTIHSGIGIYYPDFRPTQRCGVKINYNVEPTLASIQASKDLILEKALQILENE